MRYLFIIFFLFCLRTELSAQADSTFFDDGNLKSVVYGERIKEFYQSGKLQSDRLNLPNSSIERMRSGAKEWYQNGALKSEIIEDSLGYFSDWHYYENGSKKSQEISIVKVFEGEPSDFFCYSNSWCENGRKFSANLCICCDSIQVFILYFCNGSIKIKSNWHSGRFVGNFTEYHENGMVACQGQYQDFVHPVPLEEERELIGKRVGVWKYYDKNLNLIKSEFYNENGLLLDTK